MKIAQVSSPWVSTPPRTYGGTEVIVSSLTEGLVNRGHDVTLFATHDSQTQAHLQAWAAPAGYGFHFLDEILHVRQAYEHLLKSDMEIVHNHTLQFGQAFFSLLPIPSLTTCHAHYEHKYYYAELSRNHAFVSVSQRQQELAPELNWVGNIPHGIDVERFPFAAEKDDYLLFLGAIAPHKAPHVAIHIAKKLHRPLKLVGPIIEGFYYENFIAPHVDQDLIQYLGEADFEQKGELYKHASALLFPTSCEEAFGLVMIEALACGTPVIAYINGATPEVIAHKKVGFLVDNPQDMLASVSKCKSISPYECRQYVEQHFNAQLMVERYLEVYEKLIKHQKQRSFSTTLTA
jgi:glycosyltransferase involved in cell wall biosynthesis